MRAFPLSFLLFLGVVAALSEEKDIVIPKNIVQSYIKKNANFSVDPCDDFYAHVCPASSNGVFLHDLSSLKRDIVEKYRSRHPEENFFDSEVTTQNVAVVVELVKTGQIVNLCVDPNYEVFMTQFARQFLTITRENAEDLATFNEWSCEEKARFLQSVNETTFEGTYRNARMMLSFGMDALIMNTHLTQLDVKIRQLFEKIRVAIIKAISKTPWAKKNGSMNKFRAAVNKITFTTFADLRNATENVLVYYSNSMRNCHQQLDEIFDAHQGNAICDVIASGRSFRMLQQPTEHIRLGDLISVLSDTTQAFNSLDDHVYIGNDMMLLMSTDHAADLYGTIGFSMAHEIMHTIVFDERDKTYGNSLEPFWTKSAKCVAEQSLKTCQTFPTMPCDNQQTTFEEDAADMASYRIAYGMYQKSYRRKELVANYESINKQQLFFYGAAAVFCNPVSMSPQPYASGMDHSNAYQRVNSLMSQMDQFASAFHCKPSDKMVMNKAKHCELYGKNAPETKRKNSEHGFY